MADILTAIQMARATSGAPTSTNKARKAAALGLAARTRHVDPVKMLALSNKAAAAAKQPSAEQIVEKGGGIGGYLRAFRELNS